MHAPSLRTKKEACKNDCFTKNMPSFWTLEDFDFDYAAYLEQSTNPECEGDCDTVFNNELSEFGCEPEQMDQAVKSDLVNRLGAIGEGGGNHGGNHDMEEVLNNSDSIIIKKNPWDRDEVIQTVKDDRDQQDEEDEYEEEEYVNDILGAVCSKDINYMTEVELDECFGPFKPMTSEQYPILFKNIVKDSMGTILWILFIILIVLIILWFLCLFNKTGRAIFLGPEKLDELLKSFKRKGVSKMFKSFTDQSTPL